MCKKTKNAFTLAEVLITLAVIGVVAAMTIPSLINSTNDTEIITATKKAYSNLSQAFMMLQANGETCDFSTSGDSGANIFTSCFSAKFNVIKSAPIDIIFNGVKYYAYKNTSVILWDTTNPTTATGYATADGMIINSTNFGDNCNHKEPSDGSGLTNICGGIGIDVNGIKPPNQTGYDRANFWVINNNGSYQVLPTGSGNDGASCSVPGTTGANSVGCTAKIITEGKLP